MPRDYSCGAISGSLGEKGTGWMFRGGSLPSAAPIEFGSAFDGAVLAVIPDKPTQERLGLESDIVLFSKQADEGFEHGAASYFEALAKFIRAYRQIPEGESKRLAAVLENISADERGSRQAYGGVVSKKPKDPDLVDRDRVLAFRVADFMDGDGSFSKGGNVQEVFERVANEYNERLRSRKTESRKSLKDGHTDSTKWFPAISSATVKKAWNNFEFHVLDLRKEDPSFRRNPI